MLALCQVFLVLIVGADPTGLNLALALTRRNVQCHLISEATGSVEESQAMVVQARTLEFFADEVIICSWLFKEPQTEREP
jgi:2-polyprenyl-6-methoxyphenol hydroxylase-like FAD-dependent oxidoreductase